MELPQHWVTADGFSPHLGPEGGTLTVWGWSSESEADAARVAGQRLAEALERVAREGGLPAGHGYYPRVPLREPVLEEVDAASGALLGVVTRNRMGCEVLCTDLLFIADVDAPELEDATADRVGRRVRHRGEHGSAIGRRSARAPEGRGRVPAPAAVRGPGAHADDAGRAAGAGMPRMPCPRHRGRATRAWPRAWRANRCGSSPGGTRTSGCGCTARPPGCGCSSPGPRRRPSSDRARALLTELGPTRCTSSCAPPTTATGPG